MTKVDFNNLKQNLYSKIRCPECNSEIGLKYRVSENIVCDHCQAKFPIVNSVPILLSKSSRENLNLELKSHTGQQMIKEYTSKKSVFKRIKEFIKVPDLVYNLVDRTRLHKIFTYDENPEKIVLNIGGGPTREDKNVLNLNIDLFENVEVVADAHNLPFRSNSIDSVMIAAVLEHVQDPRKVVEEAYRVLKKEGYIYAETPFLQHFHGYPNHFQNFTLRGHDYLFRNFKKIESGPTTGPFSTVLILISNLFENLIENKYIRKFTLFFIVSILFPFKFLDYFVKNNKNVYRLTNGVYFLGKKSKKKSRVVANR